MYKKFDDGTELYGQFKNNDLWGEGGLAIHRGKPFKFKLD
jgi:hypothetical protein